MAVSLSDIKNFLALGTSVPDATLQFYLDDANERVVADGVASNAKDYDKLVRYAVPMLMLKFPMALANSGGSATGAVKKEKVGDVELEYGTGSSTASAGSAVLNRLSGGGYEQEYNRVLRNVIGHDHIFA